MKLLMHVCCAPCSVYCIESLRKENIEPTLFWYNPNIHPYTEYKARLDCLTEYSKSINVNLIIKDEYGLDDFCKNVSNNIESRCTNYCYPVRLKETFKYAKENGYDTVSTTLLYSIYQNHEFIKHLCEKYSKEYNIDFLYRDFRIGFWEGHDKAKEELNLYMQKYCGCIFSEEDRYLHDKKQNPNMPEGLEYPKKKSINVRKIENKLDYLDLLLEADPSKEAIDKYINDSVMYGLEVNDKIVTVAVLTEVNKHTIELKNLATDKDYRHRGYGKRLLKSLFGNYKQKYDKMIVGTSENNIPFYVKQGFDHYENTIKNFFIDNYDEEIIDNGLKCIDMYYYSKNLKGENNG